MANKLAATAQSALTRTDSSSALALKKTQATRQQQANFHSSSLVTQGITTAMSSQTVNKTNLHPGGVQ